MAVWLLTKPVLQGLSHRYELPAYLPPSALCSCRPWLCPAQMARTYVDLYVNILVAGESGQGKTTCIENLFASYHPGTKFDVHDGSATSLEVRLVAHRPSAWLPALAKQHASCSWNRVGCGMYMQNAGTAPLSLSQLV